MECAELLRQQRHRHAELGSPGLTRHALHLGEKRLPPAEVRETKPKQKGVTKPNPHKPEPDDK